MGRQHKPLSVKKVSRERPVSIQKPILPGYVYVPKGDVYVTRHCRARTLVSGLPLYVVHVHGKPKNTLGLRVPKSIALAVSKDAAESKNTRAQAVKSKDLRDLKAARDILTKLYPKLPPGSVDAILKHGFAKTSGRVGRVASIDLDRRVILAVHAWARHRHTRYETLLKTMSKDRARREVRQELEAILKQWSGSSYTNPTRSNGKSPIKRNPTRRVVKDQPQKKANKAAGKSTPTGRSKLQTRRPRKAL